MAHESPVLDARNFIALLTISWRPDRRHNQQLDYELNLDFYEVIVGEGEARSNYHLMEIESE